LSPYFLKNKHIHHGLDKKQMQNVSHSAFVFGGAYSLRRKRERLALRLSMGDKKDVFGSFYFDLNCRVLITPKACISSKRSFVYHQGESLVYHHCERTYSLRLMIYTFGDDIHDCVVMIYHCFRNG